LRYHRIYSGSLKEIEFKKIHITSKVSRDRYIANRKSFKMFFCSFFLTNTTAMKCLLIVAALVVVLAAVTVEVNGQGEDGGMCAWIKEHTGWGCDDPVSIAAWKTYLATFYDVHNCNDLCVKKTVKMVDLVRPAVSIEVAGARKGSHANVIKKMMAQFGTSSYCELLKIFKLIFFCFVIHANVVKRVSFSLSYAKDNVNIHSYSVYFHYFLILFFTSFIHLHRTSFLNVFIKKRKEH